MNCSIHDICPATTDLNISCFSPPPHDAIVHRKKYGCSLARIMKEYRQHPTHGRNTSCARVATWRPGPILSRHSPLIEAHTASNRPRCHAGASPSTTPTYPQSAQFKPRCAHIISPPHAIATRLPLLSSLFEDRSESINSPLTQAWSRQTPHPPALSASASEQRHPLRLLLLNSQIKACLLSCCHTNRPSPHAPNTHYPTSNNGHGDKKNESKPHIAWP